MPKDGQAFLRDPGALRYVLRKEVVRRCGLIAIVVGCVLTAANHYDALLFGPFTTRLAAKIAINFIVPFVVSATSAAMNRPGAGGR